ncbi:tetratricopeptide repeat protein [Sedimentibacter hydroxybenzoicus DSM 7310]|uniref:Tetratricopeptide repeat protein n=1 Tax=Sedimentibacter hydroxybenzoicus DSM 7310 TaxID=1123245 RepID=A0A974BL05_SEDHY|nr:tetratricopeptide repeat protein [Sedimentibacter hydroxybenzoicus]NYB75284.1 tetratricopeptide repeat protein [Sedimentibacter hydroxybenzoicus DSM 7310]
MSKIGERQINIMKKGLAAKGPIEMDWDMLKEVEEKLAENPSDFYGWAARGILYFNEDFEKAIESISQALALQPFNADQYYNRARKFLSQDKYVQAMSDGVMATRIDTKDAWKWHFLGVAYFFLDRYEDAVECFKKSIALHVENGTNNTPPEVDWIWMAYMRSNQVEKARESLDLMKSDTEVERGDLMYKKRVLLYKGEMTLEEFDKQVERDYPKRAITELYGAAAYCHYILKDNKKAVEYLDELLAYDTSHHAFGYKMALEERDLWSKEI